MSSIPKSCASTGVRFSVSPSDQEFYRRLGCPLPTLCPSERMRRRLAWRNEGNLHRRSCDKTGASIISIYSEDSGLPVYSRDLWWSDGWDPLEYGKDYSFDLSFVDQFVDLYSQVPRIAISNRGENADFCNFSIDFKNSYMCISGMESEDCLYCFFTSYSHACVDCSNLLYSQYCYECVDGIKLYQCKFCHDCENSSDLIACRNCVSCKDCIGCVGLYRKQYHIFNKPYSKSDYEALLEKLRPLTRNAIAKLKLKLEQQSADAIFKFYHGRNNEDVVGDYISSCKDVFRSFDVHGAERVSYSHNSPKGLLGSYDSCFTADAELLLECLSCNASFEQIGSMYCWSSTRTYYSNHCFNCSDVLGCVGLRNKQYCILNRQYSREDYLRLKDAVISRMKQEGIWGEFLPAEYSPFAYNESVAFDYFPMSKEQAIEKGLGWQDQEPSSKKGASVEEVSESIDKISDDVLTMVFNSQQSGKMYRIIHKELEYYRKMDIPLPVNASSDRLSLRLKKRNPRKFWKRKCCISGEDLVSTYAPDRPERIASEPAYESYMFQ